jgi:uncharacterized protein YdaU (DUF1376 family)
MAKQKAPAFQFYAGDYLSDQRIMLMSLEARGAYIQLLCHQWLEGSIPEDMGSLACLCGVTKIKMKKIWTEIGNHFVVDDEKKLKNPRLDGQRSDDEKWRADKSAAGRKGAESRWHSDGKGNGSAMAQPSLSDSPSSSTSPSTSSSHTCSPVGEESRKMEKAALQEVARWNADFPQTTKGIRDEIHDQYAFIRLQREEGKTSDDFSRYRAYLKETGDCPRFWQRPRELVKRTKQGNGQELWAIIEQKMTDLKPQAEYTPPKVWKPECERANGD